jgi:hypothetical protein
MDQKVFKIKRKINKVHATKDTLTGRLPLKNQKDSFPLLFSMIALTENILMIPLYQSRSASVTVGDPMPGSRWSLQRKLEAAHLSGESRGRYS